MKPALRSILSCLLASCALAAGAAPAQAHVAPRQRVVALLFAHRVYGAPGGAPTGWVEATRPITGVRTVLPVLRERMRHRHEWLLVRLPGRPNGHAGWIRGIGTRLGIRLWHIVVSLGARRAWIYYDGYPMRSWLVVVGSPSSPTPVGQFFVEENIQEPPSFPGSPYALATSARSNVFTEFDGGPGQVALHGMGGGLSATPGTAVSHGCVRFTNREITWLAGRIPVGTPVTIKP